MPIVEGSHFVYTVRPGDTLFSISKLFGSAVQLIEQTNALYPPFSPEGMIYPGQVLIVSEAGFNQRDQVTHIVSPQDTLYKLALRYSASVDMLAGINPQLTNPNVLHINQQLLAPAFIYEVEEGDSLLAIARRFGLPLRDLIEANRTRPSLSPDVIYPGYRLIMPLPSSVNIVVFRPLPGTLLQPGQSIEGYARAFEGSALYRVLDDDGRTVTQEKPFQILEGAPAFGYFSTTVRFDRQPAAATGELWVYTRSARDGSIQDLVQIRVFFST